MTRYNFAAVTLTLISCAVTYGQPQQTFPPGFSRTTLAYPLPKSTSFCVPPDGRVLIAQQNGVLRLWTESGGISPMPYHTFPSVNFGEAGFVGIEADPNYQSNHFIYANYRNTNNTYIIARISPSDDDPNVSNPAATVTVFSFSTIAGIHQGGAIHFGPDGKLYVGVGDNSVSGSAQQLTNLHGKILRLNPEPGNPIPNDNPLSFPGISGSPTGDNCAIWAVGLRNPFTFAFQPGTGRMFINDVGQDREEINDGLRGRNYGWPNDQFGAAPAYATAPLHAYAGGAITGGVFYNPDESPYPPQYYGQYFSADYSRRWIRQVNPITGQPTDFSPLSQLQVVNLGLDPQGRLLYVDYGSTSGGGGLFRLEYTAPLAPTVVALSGNQSWCSETARFSVTASGTFPLSYQWRHNQQPLIDDGHITGATTRQLRISAPHQDDLGSYDCVITNSHGEAISPSVEILTTLASFDGRDIQLFIDNLILPPPHQTCGLDFDGNGAVDLNDLPEFVGQLLGN